VVYRVGAAPRGVAPLPRPFVRDRLAKARGRHLRSACVLHARAGFAACSRAFLWVDSRAGENPIGVAAFWLAAALRDRCLRLAAMTGLRGPPMRLQPRTFARGYLTLLTLAPSFPVPSVRAVRRFRRTSSHGVFQISPLRRLQSRSPLPARYRYRAFGSSLPQPDRVPSSWFLTTSTASSSGTSRAFAARIRPWGSPRFLQPRSQISRDALLPFEAFPPLEAARLEDESSLPAGPRHRAGPSLDRHVHRAPCPLALLLRRHRAAGFPAG